MSKTKFHTLTKPIKYRRFKLIHQRMKDYIIYLKYNLLYKLNIIDKYSFNDTIRHSVSPRTFYIPDVEVVTKFIKADICFTLEHEEYFNESFYHKKGNRLKRYLTEWDIHSNTLILTATLSNIHFRVAEDGKFYSDLRDLPRIVVGDHVPLKATDLSEPFLSKPHVIEFNAEKVRYLRLVRYINCFSSYYNEVLGDKYCDMSYQIKAMSDDMVNEFKKKLNSFLFIELFTRI